MIDLTDEELNNLIGQTDLVSLVSKYVSLEKKGKNPQIEVLPTLRLPNGVVHR